MNSLDIAVLIVTVLFAVIWGAKGFLKTISGLIGFGLAYFVAAHYLDAGGAWLSGRLNVSQEAGQVIAYFGIFTGTLIVYKILAGMLLKRLKPASAGTWDHIGGGLFGAALAILILAVVIGSLTLMPSNAVLRTHSEKSRCFPYMVTIFETTLNVSDWFVPGFKGQLTSVLQGLYGATSSLRMKDLIGGETTAQPAAKAAPKQQREAEMPQYYQDAFKKMGLDLDSLDSVTLKDLMKEK